MQFFIKATEHAIAVDYTVGEDTQVLSKVVPRGGQFEWDGTLISQSIPEGEAVPSPDGNAGSGYIQPVQKLVVPETEDLVVPHLPDPEPAISATASIARELETGPKVVAQGTQVGSLAEAIAAAKTAEPATEPATSVTEEKTEEPAKKKPGRKSNAEKAAEAAAQSEDKA